MNKHIQTCDHLIDAGTERSHANSEKPPSWVYTCKLLIHFQLPWSQCSIQLRISATVTFHISNHTSPIVSCVFIQ